MKKKTKKIVYSVVAVVIVLAIVLTFALMSKSSNTVSYDKYEMQTGTLVKTVVSSASVVTDNSTYGYSPIAGEFKYVVEDGAVVQKDDVIAKIGAYSLKATCDGEVMYYFDDGADITAGSVVYKLVDYVNIHMQCMVSEQDISKISIGQEVTITMSAYFDEYYGVVTSIDKEGYNVAGSTYYIVETTIEGENMDQIYLGMTGDISVETDRVENVTTAQLDKVFFEGSKAYILVEDSSGNKVYQEIQVGFSDGLNIEVADLQAGTAYYYETAPSLYEIVSSMR